MVCKISIAHNVSSRRETAVPAFSPPDSPLSQFPFAYKVWLVLPFDYNACVQPIENRLHSRLTCSASFARADFYQRVRRLLTGGSRCSAVAQGLWRDKPAFARLVTAKCNEAGSAATASQHLSKTISLATAPVFCKDYDRVSEKRQKKMADLQGFDGGRSPTSRSGATATHSKVSNPIFCATKNNRKKKNPLPENLPTRPIL